MSKLHHEVEKDIRRLLGYDDADEKRPLPREVVATVERMEELMHNATRQTGIQRDVLSLAIALSEPKSGKKG